MTLSADFGARRAREAEVRAARQQRAADARSLARLAEAWRREVTTAVASLRMPWRVRSTWIEAATKQCCAELTHVSTGRTRVVQVHSIDATREERQSDVVKQLAAEPP